MDEVSYLCQSCGEEIVIPVDPSGGRVQHFTEDCPVCCRPHTIRVVLHRDGRVDCEAAAE